MMRRNFITISACLIFLAGCGDGQDGGDQGAKNGEAHEEHGPHGGELVELGDHVAHLEVLHDEEAGAITAFVLDADMQPIAIPDAPILNFRTSTGPKQLAGSAGTSRGEWVFSDPALRSEPEGARFRLVLNGVTYTPNVPHDHAGHDDDH